MSGRLVIHADVASLGSGVRDQLAASGLDVEMVPHDALTSGLVDAGISLALLGAQALRGRAGEEFTTLAVLKRDDPRDALVVGGGDGATLAGLEEGARVGVRGARRRAFLAAHRPDLEAVEVEPGAQIVDALRSGSLHAAVVSALEARQMGAGGVTTELLDPRAWLPEPGQGAVALVARHPIAEATALDHLPTRLALRTEVAFLDALGFPADAPVGSLAQASGRWIRLWAAVASEDGRGMVRSDLTGPLDEPEALGRHVARQILQRGAERLVGHGVR